jgi:hypothetical protein
MRLNSAIEVIDALGGTQAVADITKRTYSATHNWRSFGRFPANTFLTLTNALKLRGFDAPASLWGME